MPIRQLPLFALALCCGALACTTSRPAATPAGTPAATPPVAATQPLVVGTSSASPPFAFRRDGQLVGLEIDLANNLGVALGRPVELVDLPWEQLLDAVSSGRVDVAMAGITATRERAVRCAFSDPYLQLTMAALVRLQDRSKYQARDAVCQSPVNVGVVGGTTGEKHVRTKCPAMIPRVYPSARLAVLDLQGQRIDVVVHDAPVLAYLLSESGSDLELLATRIGSEPIAWAFRPDDGGTRDAANAALAAMRADGTLAQLKRQWIPQVQRLEAD